MIYKALLRNCPNKSPSVLNTQLYICVLMLQIVFTVVYLLVFTSFISGDTSEPSASQETAMMC